MECIPISENPLPLTLQIYHVDWAAGSLSRMSCYSITGDHTDL